MYHNLVAHDLGTDDLLASTLCKSITVNTASSPISPHICCRLLGSKNHSDVQEHESDRKITLESGMMDLFGGEWGVFIVAQEVHDMRKIFLPMCCSHAAGKL
jgi:hypothetical protein